MWKYSRIWRAKPSSNKKKKRKPYYSTIHNWCLHPCSHHDIQVNEKCVWHGENTKFKWKIEHPFKLPSFLFIIEASFTLHMQLFIFTYKKYFAHFNKCVYIKPITFITFKNESKMADDCCICFKIKQKALEGGWYKEGCYFGMLLLNLCTWEQGCLFEGSFLCLWWGNMLWFTQTMTTPHKGNSPQVLS